MMKRSKRILTFALSFVIALSHTTAVFAFDTQFYGSNDILYYDPDAQAACTNVGGGTAVSGDGNIAKMWNYLVGKGLSNEQAAGILGNIQEESGFSPFRQEGAASWPTGGYGLVQWTASRRTEIVDKMKTGIPQFDQYYQAKYGGATSPSKGYVPDGVDVTINDKFLGFELDYLYQESTTRKVRGGIGAPAGATEWDAIRAAKTLAEASNIWLLSFERPADQSPAHQAKRASNGQKILDELKNLSQTSTSTGTTSTTPTTQPTTAQVTAANKGVVAIDPGHNGVKTDVTDPTTGIKMVDYPNPPEDKNVFSVASRLKTKLEKLGYTVVMLKSSVSDNVTYRDRVDKAVAAKAVIAVSIHSTPKPGKSTATPQHVGDYRMQTPDSKKKITFDNKETATKSQAYATAIATARTKTEGHTVTTDSLDFTGRSGLAGGNIPNIMLLGNTIPWVYNEVEADDAKNSLSDKSIENYAEGIAQGIAAANPSGAPTTTGGCSSSSFAGGDFSATTLAYAWPDYRGKGADATLARPAYAEAVKKAMAAGEYVGATIAYCRANKGVTNLNDGADCGGFVTRLVHDSGWDPHYNYDAKGGPTPTQKKYLDEKWQNLGQGNTIDTKTLKPGDVAMLPGHTFIFVGNIPGFNSQIASASMCSRAPMAGKESITDADITWYRKK